MRKVGREGATQPTCQFNSVASAHFTARAAVLAARFQQPGLAEAPLSEDSHPTSPIASRFRGYLPVVIDLETSGFDHERNALLELGATIIHMNEEGRLRPGEIIFHHIKPFEGAEHNPDALAFTGIDPDHPFRMAIDEKEALTDLFRKVRSSLRATGCQRAIMVAHNASFDHAFLREAADRTGLKRNPFHPFSTLDTASISALAYGQTVLSRACQAAGIDFDQGEAHSAGYDAEKTAELFCAAANRYSSLGGWPLS